jgi:HSP20 family molecular chaperone IbpA
MSVTREENPFLAIREIFSPISSVVRDFDNYFSQDAPTRVWEDDFIHFDADVPGFKSSNLSIQLENSILTITGKTNVMTASGPQQRLLRYSFKVPSYTDTDSMTARVTDGVMSITAGKLVRNSRSKSIPILSGN